MNRLFKSLLIILSIAVFSALFITSYYLNNNMAFYRIMFRFDRDFNELSLYFFAAVILLITVATLIYRAFNRYQLLIIILQAIIISYYLLIESFLSISVTVIISSVLTLLAYFFLLLIKKPNNRKKFILIVYLLVIYTLFKTQIDEITVKLSSLDIETVRDYIASFGIFAPIVSMLLMVLQAILAPVPAFLITFANALVFGWVKGAIISWTGAMIGASICFLMARFLGRDVAEKYAGSKQLKTIDNYFNKYGKLSILVARLLPFVPFDPVSYAAGLTSMSFSGFLIATGLGQLPATIIYSYFAGNITSGAKGILWGMSAMFIISATVMTLKNRKVNDNE